MNVANTTQAANDNRKSIAPRPDFATYEIRPANARQSRGAERTRGSTTTRRGLRYCTVLGWLLPAVLAGAAAHSGDGSFSNTHKLGPNGACYAPGGREAVSRDWCVPPDPLLYKLGVVWTEFRADPLPRSR